MDELFAMPIGTLEKTEGQKTGHSETSAPLHAPDLYSLRTLSSIPFGLGFG